MIQKPYPRPSDEAMDKAWEVIDAWFLHFYQLLYFQNPPLTQPGNIGRPFNLKHSQEHSHCIRVECQPWSVLPQTEFNFLITPDTTDETVLKYCHAILDAIAAGKTKVHPSACCALAEFSNCVCMYSFKCLIHGETHIGTHD